MQKNRFIFFIIISLVLGIINSLPNKTLNTFRDFILLVAEGIGFVLGAFIISSVLLLLYALFDKTIFKKFKNISLLITVIILVIATIGTYLG